LRRRWSRRSAAWGLRFTVTFLFPKRSAIEHYAVYISFRFAGPLEAVMIEMK
jgi:hypothetical protein